MTSDAWPEEAEFVWCVFDMDVMGWDGGGMVPTPISATMTCRPDQVGIARQVFQYLLSRYHWSGRIGVGDPPSRRWDCRGTCVWCDFDPEAGVHPRSGEPVDPPLFATFLCDEAPDVAEGIFEFLCSTYSWSGEVGKDTYA